MCLACRRLTRRYVKPSTRRCVVVVVRVAVNRKIKCGGHYRPRRYRLRDGAEWHARVIHASPRWLALNPLQNLPPPTPFNFTSSNFATKLAHHIATPQHPNALQTSRRVYPLPRHRPHVCVPCSLPSLNVPCCDSRCVSTILHQDGG